MGKLIDLTGQVFGRLIVLKRDTTVEKSKGVYWICKCECGNIKSILGASLRKGATVSCGCLNKEIISHTKDIPNMVGEKFGHLTVLERHDNHVTKGGQKKATWLCKCDCGNEVIVVGQDLKTGHTKSCGCLPTKKKGIGLIDLTGQRFGKLTVIRRAKDYTYTNKNRKTTSPVWLCKCDCGNLVLCQGGNLRSGNTTNCGCEKKQSLGEIKIANYLTENNIKYLREYTFDDLRNKSGKLLRFDFAIVDDQMKKLLLVEYQGEQHYVDCGEFGAYQRNYSDKVKKEYCKSNNIPLFEIRFDEDIKESCNKLLLEIQKIHNINKV